MSELHVAELWRYPVKSMAGESLQSLELDERGAIGDRLWAVYDEDRKLGSGKHTRRFRRMDGLLDLQSRLVADAPVVTQPGGTVIEGEEALALALDRPNLRLDRESDIRHHDAAPIHIITTAGLRWLQEMLPESELDSRRFRPNLVIAAPGMRPVEQDWIGNELVIAGVRLTVVGSTERCRMVGAPQQELGDDNRVLKSLGVVSDLQFGVYAEVAAPGAISVGEHVAIE
jgi:uncharacterized protein YcbX